jgi:hypothetical protein
MSTRQRGALPRSACNHSSIQDGKTESTQRSVRRATSGLRRRGLSRIRTRGTARRVLPEGEDRFLAGPTFLSHGPPGQPSPKLFREGRMWIRSAAPPETPAIRSRHWGVNASDTVVHSIPRADGLVRTRRHGGVAAVRSGTHATRKRAGRELSVERRLAIRLRAVPFGCRITRSTQIDRRLLCAYR